MPRRTRQLCESGIYHIMANRNKKNTGPVSQAFKEAKAVKPGIKVFYYCFLTFFISNVELLFFSNTT